MTVAEALWSTERALDSAFGELADLLGTVTRARQDGNFGMMVGQDAVNELAAAIPEMTVVRDRLIEAHRRLDKWQKRMGLDTTPKMGTGLDKPQEAAIRIEPLRSAA
ncbi:MAG: hypothetical protein WA840_22600 [Caulobacteraceae bacterium]